MAKKNKMSSKHESDMEMISTMIPDDVSKTPLSECRLVLKQIQRLAAKRIQDDDESQRKERDED